MRPDSSEYADFYANYVELASEDSIISALEHSKDELVDLLQPHLNNQTAANFRYDTDKWSVNELLAHIIDADTVFYQRALWAARSESSNLPGYDHNAWVTNSPMQLRSLELNLNWFVKQREIAIAFYQTLPDELLSNSIIASEVNFTVRSLGFIMAGHARHHKRILEERYLNQI